MPVLSKSPSDDQVDKRGSYDEINDKHKSATLDLSLAFPQATPASKFPTSKSDYYDFIDLLTPEERAVQLKVREFAEKEIAPIMSEYWEKAEYPFHIIPKLAALHITGTIKGYGCPGLSAIGAGISLAEIARVDASCSSVILGHTYLVMIMISMFGSEAQKQKYLPPLADLNPISCWALTEPNYGSDASSLKTTATKVEGGWILNGQKRWIGNSTFAGLFVIFARNNTTNQINAFLIKKGTPGLTASKIENKIAFRIMQNGDILMKNVFVPEDDRLPDVKSFRQTSEALAFSRVMVAWQAIGIAMGVYDMCHRYLHERRQFGEPLVANPSIQQKLVQMLGDVQAMTLVGWRICKLYEIGKMTTGQASLAKAWISKKGREMVALGREMLGANGFLTDFLIAKAFVDMEVLYTYEGSYDVTTLVTGREITGIAAFKRNSPPQQSRL